MVKKYITISLFISVLFLDVNDVQGIKDDALRVTRIVLDQQKNIDAKGKDLVIFIGTSQVGKSTAINALLNGPLEMDDEGNIIHSVEKEIAKVGEDGKGRSCTDFPSTYSGEKSGQFVFLDTRGLLDCRVDKDNEIAASVLTELAVNEANSVRLVILEKYEKLVGGLVDLGAISGLLGKVITSDDISILFLFNRFTTSNRKEFRSYDAVYDYPEERTKFVEKKLDEVILNVIKSSNESKRDFEQKMQNLGNLSCKEVDGLMKESEQRGRYTSLLEAAYTQGNYAYIDPTYTGSLNSIYEHIMKVPTVDRKCLNFGAYSKERIEFDDKFGNLLVLSTKVLNRFNLTRRYNKNEIGVMRKGYIRDLDEHKKAKKEISKLFKKSELCNQEDKDALDYYEKAYEIRSEDIKIQEERLYSTLLKLEEEKAEFQEKIYDIENAKEEVFWRDDWVSKGGFGFWRRHHSVYNEGVPFVKVERNLGGSTMIRKTVKNKSPEFEEYYTSGSIKNTLGNIWENTKEGVEMGLYVGGGAGALVGGAAGFLVELPLAIAAGVNGEDYGKAVLTGLGGCAGGVVGAGGGLVAGAIGGSISGVFTARDCSGTVTIYVLPKDVPGNIDAVNSYNESIRKINEQMEERKKEYEAYRFDKMKNGSLQGKVANRINYVENQIKKVDTIIDFYDDVKEEYEENEEEIQSQMDIVNKLHMNDGMRRRELVRQFVNSYNEVRSGENEVRGDGLDIEYLCSKIAEYK